MLDGYFPLSKSILTSTIWREPAHITKVWLTMLISASKTGVMLGSIPGLANLSQVSLDECEDALARLADPDKYSRTKENEGRRIIDVDGGWQILNYRKHRDLILSEHSNHAMRQERYRQRKRHQASPPVTGDGHVDPNDDQDQYQDQYQYQERESTRARDELNQRRERGERWAETTCPDELLEYTDRHKNLAQRIGEPLEELWLDFRAKRRAKGALAAMPDGWSADFEGWLSSYAKNNRERAQRVSQGHPPGYRPEGRDAPEYEVDPAERQRRRDAARKLREGAPQ